MKQILLDALVASMKVVRENQGLGNQNVELKRDNTLRTKTDTQSEQAMLGVLLQRFPESMGLELEEKGKIRSGNGKVRILGDSLDGTKTFVIGALSSTVIVSVHEEETRQVTLCLVGEPASGRVWEAEKGLGTFLRTFDFTRGQFVGTAKQVRVSSPNPPFSCPTVFLDLYPGFTRRDARVFSNVENAHLFTSLFGKYGITMLGSNGLHHALVANGADGIAGAITTAIGGAHDVSPALLVLEAGGAAAAYSVEAGGGLKARDPLDVFSYHFLITGNTVEVVADLSGILRSIRPDY